MNNYFIILAAGSGKRFDKRKPKQYFLYKNKELLEIEYLFYDDFEYNLK